MNKLDAGVFAKMVGKSSRRQIVNRIALVISILLGRCGDSYTFRGTPYDQ